MAESRSNFRRYLRFSSMGLEMGLSVVIGLLIGIALDNWLGTKPWLMLLFLLFGIVAAFRVVLRMLRELEGRNNDNDERA